MENKAHALAAGAFVLLLATLLVTLAVWLTRESGTHRRYEVSTRDAVTGLQPQAPVRFRGIKVGQVAEIGFDLQVPGNVLLRLDLDAATPLTRSTFATLGYQGLTGIAFVQLDDSGESREPLAASDPPARIPMRPGLMDQLQRQGGALLGQLEEASRRINTLLAPSNQQALRQSLDALAGAAAAVPPAMQRTGEAMQSMREAAAVVSSSAAQVRQAAHDYAALAQRLQQPGGALAQLQQGAGALSATGQALQQSSLPRLDRALEETGRTARQLGRAGVALEENPQALLYGPPRGLPGPGEPGFVVPGGGK